MSQKITPEQIRQMKGKKKIVSLTAYDYPFARIVDHAGVDIILVGDSLGMVVLGESSTQGVTMEDMERHTSAVCKGVVRALVVSDLPLGSFETPKLAIKNAKRLIEAGAEAVKIEGYGESVAVVDALLQEGIAVMGHLGLTPQVAKEFKVQGKSEEDANRIFSHAKKFDELGVFSLVLECIPNLLASRITQEITTPTIGIGAGNVTDGQILVTHDLLGLYPNIRPKFVRQYINLSTEIQNVIMDFKEDVESGEFPNESETFHE